MKHKNEEENLKSIIPWRHQREPTSSLKLEVDQSDGVEKLHPEELEDRQALLL